MSGTVAALYVEKGGVYYGLPDVDPWDEERDARLYDGPWPVVAHPPCARWSIMGLCRPEYARGDDGGCFEAALAAVRRFGGILEHPRYSLAWEWFGLPYAARFGWTRSMTDDGWSTEVDQGAYGAPFRKPTWLYYVGEKPPPALDWRTSAEPRRAHNLHSRRSRTPPAFRDALLAMASNWIPSLVCGPPRDRGKVAAVNGPTTLKQHHHA